jgi:hypothetical protein
LFIDVFPNKLAEIASICYIFRVMQIAFPKFRPKFIAEYVPCVHMMLQNTYEMFCKMFCTVLHPVQTYAYVCKEERTNPFLELIVGVPSVTMPTSLDISTLSS